MRFVTMYILVASRIEFLYRFLGFDPLVQSFCSADASLNVLIDYNRDVNFDSYLNPLAIIVCYYTLAITSGLILSSTVIIILSYFMLLT